MLIVHRIPLERNHMMVEAMVLAHHWTRKKSPESLFAAPVVHWTSANFTYDTPCILFLLFGGPVEVS